MSELIQGDRPIGIETPLGQDVLVLTSFVGEERISGLFSFELQLMSDRGDIKPDEIVGQNIDFYVRYPDGEPRYFNGHVNRFTYRGQGDRAHIYTAHVVPWMWFLTKGADCKVHETGTQQSAQDIIDGLLSELGYTDFKWDLQRTPEKRDYCVQYRETHFEFVTRLLAEEGIYYYFKHEQGKHELVMTDHVGGVFDCEDGDVQLLSNLAQPELTDNLSSWNHDYEFTTGKYAHTDYNFETPSTPLLVTKDTLVSLPDVKKHEVYDFPGEYADKGLGEGLAQLRMESEEVAFDTVNGSSECRSFSPGGKFSVAAHHNNGEAGGKWVLTVVQHTADQGGQYFSGGSHSDDIYKNSFKCIPADVVFRPPFRPRPGIHGIQSAVVTGPAGEEIYTDEHGRVKVQFHWDRLGKKDENSSFWVRVSQVHAGEGWGMMDIPRIGEEVIVSFLEGDPDQPLIVGRVYNAEKTPPFSLPAEKTRRGNSTKTHKGGGYNELSMDDTAGSEQIRINAQYNMDTTVGNNQTLDVGVDRTVKIGSNEAITIGADLTLAVGNNRTVTVETDEDIDIGSNQKYKIGSNQTGDVGATREVTIADDDKLTATNQTVGLSGKQTTDVDSDISIKSGTNIKVEAGASIELIVGGNSIKIDQAGITIKGIQVNVEGTATVGVKAPKTDVNGDAMLTLMGAMTKIN